MFQKFKETLLDWLSEKLQPIIERKLVLKDTYELERVDHKGVRLPYVLLENKTTVINKFRIPIKLESIQLTIYNKEIVVGSVIFDESVKIKPMSKQNISVEVRLSHITAIFQMLRLLIVDTICIDVRGEIQIKFLGMNFFIPVQDQVDIPRSKLRMITESIRESKDTPLNIPYEDVIQEEEDFDPQAKPLDE